MKVWDIHTFDILSSINIIDTNAIHILFCRKQYFFVTKYYLFTINDNRELLY